MGKRPLRRCTIVASLLALAVAAAPSPAAAQTTDAPECLPRSQPLEEPMGLTLESVASRVRRSFVRGNVIRSLATRPEVNPTYSNQLAFGMLEAGGKYCRDVGNWLAWQLDHLSPNGALYAFEVDEQGNVVDPNGSEPDEVQYGFDNRQAGLLTLARMYVERAATDTNPNAGRDWLAPRMPQVIKAASYLNQLYDDLGEGVGLTKLSEPAYGLLAPMKYFQDNVASWAGYRDYAVLLGKYAAYAHNKPFYVARAQEIHNAIETFLYDDYGDTNPDTGSYINAMNTGTSMGFACWFPGAYGNTMGLWLGASAPETGLPHSFERRGALFTNFISPANQLGWAVRDLTPSPECDNPKTENVMEGGSTTLNTQLALAAVRASSQDVADQGGLHHQATAIVFESNLLEAPDPFSNVNKWTAMQYGAYMRYLATIGVHAIQDDSDTANTTFSSPTSTAWNTVMMPEEDAPDVDGRSVIHAGESHRWWTEPAATATFTPNIPKRGLYSVRVVYQRRTDTSPPSSPSVEVKIKSKASGSLKETIHPVDQTKHMSHHTTHPIPGSYCFYANRSTDGSGSVIVGGGATAPGRVSADAVVFQRVGSC